MLVNTEAACIKRPNTAQKLCRLSGVSHSADRQDPKDIVYGPIVRDGEQGREKIHPYRLRQPH